MTALARTGVITRKQALAYRSWLDCIVGCRSPNPINSCGNQDEWAYLFGLLHDDARARELPEDEFHYIGDHMLMFFVRCQGYEELLELVAEGAMTRIRCAYEIWRPMPEAFYPNLFSELVLANLSSLKGG